MQTKSLVLVHDADNPALGTADIVARLFPTSRDRALPFRDQRRASAAAPEKGGKFPPFVDHDGAAALRLARLIGTMWSVVQSVELAYTACPMPEGLQRAHSAALDVVNAFRAGNRRLTEGEASQAAYGLADAIAIHGGREARS